MSKSNAFETALLLLIFNGTPIDDIADNAGTSPASDLYVSLHTADPGDGGNQSTSETTYSSYARVAVARTSGGWTVSGNSVSPVAAITFPTGTGGSGTVTHFGVGVAPSGTGSLLYSGTVSPNLDVGNGITPELTTATTITED